MERDAAIEKGKPGLKRSKLINQFLVFFLILLIPIIAGMLILGALGLILGMAIGAVILLLYCEFTGRF